MKMTAKEFYEHCKEAVLDEFVDSFNFIAPFVDPPDCEAPWSAPWEYREDAILEGDTIKEMATIYFYNYCQNYMEELQQESTE